jgi:uncharacterized protein (TIGR00730 family)
MIGVFCGARTGVGDRFVDLARRTGRLLAECGAGVVYGGGRVGMMGALADAALAAGGRVIGVIPAALMAREVGHAGVSALQVVDDMHERKRLMIARSDAFLVLPGGFGTLDELSEVLTLRQLGQHAKPIAVVDDQGYFSGLHAVLTQWVEHGLVDARDLAMLARFPAPEAALPYLGLVHEGRSVPG